MPENDASSARALELYSQLLNAWNRRSADDFAERFGKSGSCIGFDGSMMNGQSEIGSTLSAIFAQHPTASYVAKVREVRPLGAGVTLVRAVAGMIPPGKNEINAAVNAVQSLVVAGSGQDTEIALFQNTPAAFHGRPELSERLTKELSDVARAGLVVDAG
ncbi:SgcJ/EcaC family oxidoreductase [bacterium]|nr:SgcJ/EcaC family oxidoreductase [bacterium]